MILSKISKAYCVAGCELFNDSGKFSYWENRNVTSDEIDIVNFLNSKHESENLNILHVGIGNSYIASKLNIFKEIIGITISQNEILNASSKNISNYKFFFINKYKKNSLDIFDNKKFDIIIDANMKSFSCCDMAFKNLFNQYGGSLGNNGYIITHINGIKWSRMVKPKLAFSFKNLFYKRLKEYDGPINNLLSISDCKILAGQNNLKLELVDKNLIVFKNDK